MYSVLLAVLNFIDLVTYFTAAGNSKERLASTVRGYNWQAVYWNHNNLPKWWWCTKLSNRDWWLLLIPLEVIWWFLCTARFELQGCVFPSSDVIVTYYSTCTYNVHSRPSSTQDRIWRVPLKHHSGVPGPPSLNLQANLHLVWSKENCKFFEVVQTVESDCAALAPSSW